VGRVRFELQGAAISSFRCVSSFPVWFKVPLFSSVVLGATISSFQVFPD